MQIGTIGAGDLAQAVAKRALAAGRRVEDDSFMVRRVNAG